MDFSPNISVIIPTYNRANTLSKAINSVINQSYSDWELLIIDDRSTDDTKSLIDNYIKKDSRIKYFVNKRKKGPSGARNQGITLATGKYISFLDSDDEWSQDHLEKSICVLENENVSVCFALWIENRYTKSLEYFNIPGKAPEFELAKKVLNPRIKDNLVFFGPGFCEHIILETFYCHHINTLVLDRDILKTIGLFNEGLFTGEDNEFTFRLIHEYDFCLILEHHLMYNQGDDNLYLFIDRQAVDYHQIKSNRKVIDKISFNLSYEIKMYKLLKKLVINSSKIKRKSESINVINKKLCDKNFAMGYINMKIHRIKALSCLIKSLRYGYDSNTLALIKKLVIPFYNAQINVDSSKLDIG